MLSLCGRAICQVDRILLECYTSDVYFTCFNVPIYIRDVQAQNTSATENIWIKIVNKWRTSRRVTQILRRTNMKSRQIQLKEKQKQNYLRFCSFKYDRLILEQNLTWKLFLFLSIQCTLILRKQRSYFFVVVCQL